MFQSLINFVSSLAFAFVATFGINLGTNEPHYEVIEREGEKIEIRRYPIRIVAETTVDASQSDNPRREAFTRIAGYIFGANKGQRKIEMTSPVEINSLSEKIEMTAPVEVSGNKSVVVMRFFMPSNYSKSDLPEPMDPTVKLIELAPTTVAVLQFSGSTNPALVSA